MSVIEQAITKQRAARPELPARSDLPAGPALCDAAKRFYSSGPNYQAVSFVVIGLLIMGGAWASILLMGFLKDAGAWAPMTLFCVMSLAGAFGGLVVSLCQGRRG